MNIKQSQREVLSRKSGGSETEYLLAPSSTSVWITVGNISIYLRRHDWGVCLDLYPIEQSDSDSLASTWLSFDEAQTESK